MPTFRGKPACSCLVTWLPVFEAELKRRGVIKNSIDIWQLIGGAKASGGTHSTGGAFDIAQRDATTVKVAREMGAAFWDRPKNWDNRGGMAHGHGVLNGCPHNAPARYQIADLARGLNGLANHARDTGPEPRRLRTWQDGIKWAKAQQKVATVAKPKKPARQVKPWVNVSFQNTHWNSVVGGKALSVAKTSEPLVEISTAGNPAIASFSEVRPSQIGTLNAAMGKTGYKLVAYAESNMIAAYSRADVQILGHSFAKFSKQDGGNIEGVLRVKFRVGGSRAQVGIVHLDVDASEAKKASNVKEAYNALRRYGITTLLPDWKSRTLIIGDWNDPDVAAKVLKPLGFKQMDTGGARIDQAFVGAKRPDRGGAATSAPSDHKRIVARLGRY
jgi:hypothetical protein